jgi:hypothetical protein
MGIKTPVLDNRTSEDIYREALELARIYCPELAIPADERYFNPDDPGLVLFKLFAKLTEFLITQFYKVPEKHRLAFFDFAGMDLRPARPSEVMLTFYLAEGSSGVIVPFATRVASSKDPDVIFETTQDLNVVPVKLNAVYSLNSWEDKYTDHSKAVSGNHNECVIFGKDTDEKPLDHILYLGDDFLLHIRKPVKLVIHLAGTNLLQEYFGRWYDGNNNVIENPDFSSKGAAELDIILNIQTLEPSSINAVEGFWLSVRPNEDKQIIKGMELSTISDITADITVEHIIPDIAFFNTIPLDMKKGFYPFGEEPKKGDELYIGSEEAFSKQKADITLHIGVEAKNEFNADTLEWEYWNGSTWELLELIKNAAQPDDFVPCNIVSFTCPCIPPAEMNGQLNRWIRVKIVSEAGYGTPGKLEPKKLEDIIYELSEESDDHKDKIIQQLTQKRIAFGFEYKAPDFTPPFIKSIRISYMYQAKQFGKLISFNNFRYKNFEPGGKPYTFLDEMPALFLGFDESIINYPITLFFATKEGLYNETEPVIMEPGYQDQTDLKQFDETTSFIWKYYNGNFWKEFGVKDETDSFRTGGIVSFLVPADIKSSFEFERDFYWIKVEINNRKWISCPKLHGIFQNTVRALNTITVKDEILGSGNGEPNVTLSFSRKPVLEGQIIEVEEVGIPSQDELRIIESENGEDALRVIKEQGETKEVWVRWHEVKNFTFSVPLSRHYMLDRAQGQIIFGDGVRGMIPPNRKNIVARQYKSGGGTRGDVEAGTISSLKKAIPNIESVINHVPSSGGLDHETIESIITYGPERIKNRNRAVTKEDFEWLALEASQYVARAKCLSEDGKITIIIVPKYGDDTPFPDAGLLDLVEKYLKKRAFVTIVDRIEVVGPDYKIINVNIKVKPTSISESIIVSERISIRLKTFLHPLKGGSNGGGWDFGQDIFISKMAAVIEDLEGVDYVKEIKLKKFDKEKTETASGVKQILIEPNALPCAGNINVIIEG